MTVNLFMFALRDGGLRELFGLTSRDALFAAPLDGLAVSTFGLAFRLAFSNNSAGGGGDGGGGDVLPDCSPEISIRNSICFHCGAANKTKITW